MGSWLRRGGLRPLHRGQGGRFQRSLSQTSGCAWFLCPFWNLQYEDVTAGHHSCAQHCWRTGRRWTTKNHCSIIKVKWATNHQIHGVTCGYIEFFLNVISLKLLIEFNWNIRPKPLIAGRPLGQTRGVSIYRICFLILTRIKMTSGLKYIDSQLRLWEIDCVTIFTSIVATNYNFGAVRM